VKLIRDANDHLLFQLGAREKGLLLEILKLYPCLPPAHQRISKSGRLPSASSSQRLLDEALAEQRAENKKQIQHFLSDPKRFVAHDKTWRLFLSATEADWLLRILNDIRVGSWVLLGSPEERIPHLDAKSAPHLWAMEMAGAFEMVMLEALKGRKT